MDRIKTEKQSILKLRIPCSNPQLQSDLRCDHWLTVFIDFEVDEIFITEYERGAICFTNNPLMPYLKRPYLKRHYMDEGLKKEVLAKVVEYIENEIKKHERTGTS